MSDMNVSSWAIRNPVPPILMFAVLAVLGWMSFVSMPVMRFPNIDIPLVSVTVSQSGSTPVELETQVTKTVEDAVSNITGVKNVQSTITDGVSTTVIEFRLEVSPDKAVSDVKDAIDGIVGDLPRSAETPIVAKIDAEGQAIITFAARAPGLTPEQLSWYVDDVVLREMQGVKGVGRAQRMGGVTREVVVDLDPDRLMALSITAQQVNAQLRAVNTDVGGGRGDVGGVQQAIRTLSSARTVADLSATEIALPGGRKVRLDELGTVSDTWEEPKSFARFNGEPVVAFQIYRSKGASELDVSNAVDKKIAELAASRPDVVVERIDDLVRYTVGNYESAMMTLVEGAILAVIVVFIFLRDWRATIITAVAIPLSIIPAFWVMSMIGFSLNLVSLLAVILVTGILVDDAIVEIENIVRHQKMGKSPYRAAIDAADEIGLAVIAITMTIIAIFAPVSFMPGVAGQYFKQFGLTVAIAVFMSLLVARLITPMMAAYLMKPVLHEEPRDGWLMRGYTRFLRGTVRFRWLTLFAGLLIFAVSIWATKFLPEGFLPEEDVSRIVASVEMPPGSTLEDTRIKTDEAAAMLREVEEVAGTLVIGGSSATGTRDVRRATLIIKLTPKGERALRQIQVEEKVLARLAAISDMRFYFVNDRGERKLAINVLGNDAEALSTAVAAIEREMRANPVFLNPAADASLPRPEIRVEPKLDKLAELGLTTVEIADAVRVATIGDSPAALAKFTEGTRQVPIRVRLETAARSDLGVLESLQIPLAAGGSVPLSSVAVVRFDTGPSSIERFNRERRVKIGADMAGGAPIGIGSKAIAELAAVKALPPGVRVQETGDAEIQEEVNTGFVNAMGAGIMLVFVILILLLGGVFQPITILFALPLSVGGVVAALLLTNNAMTMPVFIGILMLMGIVTKNSIMLVDFAVERVKHGMKRIDAVVDAGRKRARPIIMTTIAMSAGMVPAALATGEGGEFRAPMAIAVIGGLIASTLLSLVFIPSLYTIMDDMTKLTSWLFGRFVGPNEDKLAAEAAARAAFAPVPATTPLPEAEPVVVSAPRELAPRPVVVAASPVAANDSRPRRASDEALPSAAE